MLGSGALAAAAALLGATSERTVVTRLAWLAAATSLASLLGLLPRRLTEGAALTSRGRVLALCELEWSADRAMRCLAVLDRMSNGDSPPPAEALLVGVSPTRRAAAEPKLRRVVAFWGERKALRSTLLDQRALVPADDDERLSRLWAALLPSLDFVRRSEEWARLGFQGVDPTTDFRSLGGVALRDLLHLVHQRPALCAGLVEGWSAELQSALPPRSLPLALTSINASAWLWSLFEAGLLDRCLLVRGATVLHYRDLFLDLVEGFCAHWSRSAPEDVMAFETIAQAYLARVRKTLQSGSDVLAVLVSA